MKKHQQLTQCDTGLCLTIPEKAIEALGISTKRFMAWEKRQHEIVGTLCASETVATTRVRTGPQQHYLADVLPAYVAKYHLLPTKQGGPTAVCEWDETSLRVVLPLPERHATTTV